MSANLQTFSKDLAAFAKKIDVNIGTVTRKVAIDIFSDVVKRTPVDTGRARAGWQVTTGSPGDFVPPLPIGGFSASGPIHRKKADPGHYPPPTANFDEIDGTQVVYIVNNVEYIQALEDGHSKQAPAGMVKLALATAEVAIEQALQGL